METRVQDEPGTGQTGIPIFSESKVRRDNLLLLSRLVVRGLLECCMKAKTRLIGSENRQLQDFFVVVEKVLKHGLLPPRNVLNLKSPEDQLWAVVQRLGKSCKEADESISCVKHLPYVHSSICRVRAWLRLAMMQKKLADYFLTLVESREILREFYDPSALLRHETTGVVFAGTLIGLRVLDCNLYLKEDELSKQCQDIDMNLYVKIPTVSVEDEDQEEMPKLRETDIAQSNGEAVINNNCRKSIIDTSEMKAILDQKNYLEERNRVLSTRLETLQVRLEILEQMKRHNVCSGPNGFTELQSLSPHIESPDSSIHSSGEHKPGGNAQVDFARMVARMEEMEVAMALMEKDIHEKQDTIVGLRQQIEDIKKINLDIYQKMRLAEDGNKAKDKQVRSLEEDQKKEIECRRNLEERIICLETRLKSQETFQLRLEKELCEKVEFCARVEQAYSDLKGQFRNCEEALTSATTECDAAKAKLDQLANIEKDYLHLKAAHDVASKKVHDYELTLEELGVHLEESKLKVEDLRESAITLADAQWESDKETNSCKQCEKPFNVARRKHHCRNCGGIYCNPCSENSMPLPSSAKPVRVCDACYALLLKRYSVAPV